jgi:alcohol dehydrogenase class IV
LQRVLVVCGANVGHLGAVQEVTAAHRDLFPAVFDQVEPDPSDRTIAAGGGLAAKLQVDGILGVGGGSSLDAAKAIAAEAVQPGWVLEQDDPGQPTQVPDEILPIVAVPTTAGTASEVTPFSVITYTATRRKGPLSHPALYPKLAVLDPELLLSAPREARVAAGMDALTHAIESYLSRQATDQTRKRSQAAVEDIARSVVEATAPEPDLHALAQLQRAAMIAGLAFAVSRLGIVHAAALPLSALFGIPHGIANAILLPHGMAFNEPAAEEDMGNLAGFLSVHSRKSAGTAMEAGTAVRQVRELARLIGAPEKLSEVGVAREAIAGMAETAALSPNLKNNPRPATVEDLQTLYEQAW